MTQKKGLALVTAMAFSVGVASLVGQTQTQPPTQTPPQNPPQTQTEKKPPKPMSERAEVTETFTIEAIDYQSRLVTLKDSKGNMDTVTAGPEVKRFSELKPGDKIKMTYYESVLYSIRPSTGTAPPESTSTMHRETTGKPGATMTKTLTASVVIDAIDLNTPSVSVKTDDGKTMSFKVKDKKNLEQLKVGDRVDIAYTRGLAVKVQ
jgi:Cu/Ag efflux protein CusF